MSVMTGAAYTSGTPIDYNTQLVQMLDSDWYRRYLRQHGTVGSTANRALDTEAFWGPEFKYKEALWVKIRNRERGAELTKNSSPLSKKGAGQTQEQIICMTSWEVAINLPHIKNAVLIWSLLLRGITRQSQSTAYTRRIILFMQV